MPANNTDVLTFRRPLSGVIAMAGRRRSPRARQIRHRHDGWAGIFLLPKFLIFVAFVIVPFFWSLALVFQQGNLLYGFRWAGLQNIRDLISDDLFRETLKHTFTFVAIVIPASLLFPCMIGAYLARQRTSAGIYRTLIYAPSLLSVVATGIVWQYMASVDGGPLYKLFNELLGINVPWLSSPSFALFYIAIASVWSSLGLLSVIFMAGFLAIDPEMIEAAVIDGASGLQIFWRVKLPQLRRVCQLVLILVSISSVQVFDMVFVLTKGGPGTSTYTAQWYVYQNVYNGGSMGYAAVMGVVLLLICSALSMIAVLITRAAP